MVLPKINKMTILILLAFFTKIFLYDNRLRSIIDIFVNIHHKCNNEEVKGKCIHEVKKDKKNN